MSHLGHNQQRPVVLGLGNRHRRLQKRRRRIHIRHRLTGSVQSVAELLGFRFEPVSGSRQVRKAQL